MAKLRALRMSTSFQLLLTFTMLPTDDPDRCITNIITGRMSGKLSIAIRVALLFAFIAMADIMENKKENADPPNNKLRKNQCG